MSFMRQQCVEGVASCCGCHLYSLSPWCAIAWFILLKAWIIFSGLNNFQKLWSPSVDQRSHHHASEEVFFLAVQFANWVNNVSSMWLIRWKTDVEKYCETVQKSLKIVMLNECPVRTLWSSSMYPNSEMYLQSLPIDLLPYLLVYVF